MSGWFLLASAIVQYQRKIKLLNKLNKNTGEWTMYAWKVSVLGIIQPEYGKIRTRITQNIGTFYAVFDLVGRKLFFSGTSNMKYLVTVNFQVY